MNSSAAEFQLERYKYILQRLHAVNENVYRFFGIYQAAVTALLTAMLALFVTFRQWQLSAVVARAGVVGLGVLITLVALFVVLLIIVGIASWFNYRNEECALTDEMVAAGFRARPTIRKWYTWYEIYMLLFVVCTVASMWFMIYSYMLPAMVD